LALCGDAGVGLWLGPVGSGGAVSSTRAAPGSSTTSSSGRREAPSLIGTATARGPVSLTVDTMRIGGVDVRGLARLAPMAGATNAPFRLVARGAGAG
jgi:hypothetical protein